MSLKGIQSRNAADRARGIKRVYNHTEGAKAAKAVTVAPIRRAMFMFGDCVHGGTDADIVERCPSCQGGAKHVRECAIFDRVTWEPGGKVMSCRECRLQGLGHVSTSAHPNIIAADAFARSLSPCQENRYSGRGVVICGGGAYWPSVYVTVRMLRHVGCTLPVQVWYLGEPERDDRYKALLAPFGAEVVDAMSHPEVAKTRGLTGFPDTTNRTGSAHPPFQVKTFAVLHSPFAEALSLDADNYPCADPTAMLDEPRYKRSGAVFWPDLPHTNAWTRWADWGIKEHGPEVGFEVGQYLIDKRKAWGPLQLARWYDDRGDWCYGWGAHHDHGDKGSHRVAWARFQRTPTFFATEPVWQEIGFVQVGPDGATPMFCHRTGSKFVLESTAFSSSPQKRLNVRAGLPMEEEAFGYLDELRRVLG